MKQPCMLFAALAVASTASFVSGSASAQSNVAIYGVADAGVAYASNQNGNANTYLRSGSLSASKIGLQGVEALGGDLQALFLLESGFELDSGAQSASGSLFNRQAYVGLLSRAYGVLTAGRQYTPYYRWSVRLRRATS
jgi:predicted porin